MRDEEFDLVVVGCGAAGLSAAVSAAEGGCRVAVLERAPREREPSKVVNLMDALRRSVEGERGGERRKPARAAGNARAPRKAGRSSARAKKAG